jgi:hypothetical protein
MPTRCFAKQSVKHPSVAEERIREPTWKLHPALNYFLRLALSVQMPVLVVAAAR